MNDPSSSPLPADLRAGNLLTRALVEVAAEHARERGVPDRVVLAALTSALGYVAVSIAKTNGYDLGKFQAAVTRHLQVVVMSEARRRFYTIH